MASSRTRMIMAIDHCSNSDKKLIMQERRPWMSKEMFVPVVVVVVVVLFLGNHHRRHLEQERKASYFQFWTYLR